MSILIFIIVLGLLIFVHELGHFLVAKKSGIRVDEFAIGFRPRLFSFKRGGTRYALNLIPFGGYVKIFGENPDEGADDKNAKDSMLNKPKWIQALVLVAGVTFNVIFAWFIFVLLFVRGGDFNSNIVPFMPTPEGVRVVDRDELLRPESTIEGMKDLKTPFRANGKVTAGNASPLTDGATISLLAGDAAVKQHGLKPRMRMVGFAFAGVEPEIMGIGPIPSTEKALKKAGLSISDIGLFEINEAFAVQVLSFLEHFKIADDDARVNAWGGAIAFGHPLASSGVRLMNQLSRQFEMRPDVRYGITTMCIGLGMGGTVIWENEFFDGKKN